LIKLRVANADIDACSTLLSLTVPKFGREEKCTRRQGWEGRQCHGIPYHTNQVERWMVDDAFGDSDDDDVSIDPLTTRNGPRVAFAGAGQQSEVVPTCMCGHDAMIRRECSRWPLLRKASCTFRREYCHNVPHRQPKQCSITSTIPFFSIGPSSFHS